MTRIRIRKQARRRDRDTAVPEGPLRACSARAALLETIDTLLEEIDHALDEARSSRDA